MAKTACINGHPMWNGDGKPVVYAFRVGFFQDYVKKYPDRVLGMEPDEDGWFYQMYDCVDDAPGEDLDCWYCDECGSLAVFVDHLRYDYIRADLPPEMTLDMTAGWEDYIALRDRPFEDFQDYYEGMNPMDAISTYPFTYRYKVSPDKKQIVAYDADNNIAFGFELARFIDFDKPQEPEKEPEPYEFNKDEYCRMMEETVEHVLGETLDYTVKSIDLLDAVIVKVRDLHAKGILPDTDIMWNVAVCAGTYFGEIMLKDRLAAAGFSWNTKHHPPVLTNDTETSIVEPIGEAHKAMYVSERSAEHALYDYYRNIQFLMDYKG